MWTFIFNNRAQVLLSASLRMRFTHGVVPFLRVPLRLCQSVNYFKVRHTQVIYYRSHSNAKLLWSGNGNGWSNCLDDNQTDQTVRWSWSGKRSKDRFTINPAISQTIFFSFVYGVCYGIAHKSPFKQGASNNHTQRISSFILKQMENHIVGLGINFLFSLCFSFNLFEINWFYSTFPIIIAVN